MAAAAVSTAPMKAAREGAIVLARLSWAAIQRLRLPRTLQSHAGA